MKATEAAISLLSTAVDKLEVKGNDTSKSASIAGVGTSDGSNDTANTVATSNSKNSALSRIATRQQKV